MAVQISYTDLKQKINAGWKKEQLSIHYGLPQAQITRVLQQTGLQIRKFHRPKFELIMDDAIEIAPEVSNTEVSNEVEDIVPDMAPDDSEAAQW